MSNELDLCPYYHGMDKTSLHCTGMEEGVAADLVFPKKADCMAHYECFCSGKYSDCAMLSALDEAHRSCPHNCGIQCFQTDECGGCGWEPGVAARRLAEVKRQLYAEWRRKVKQEG